MNLASPRYAQPRPAKTARNWALFHDRHIKHFTYSQLVIRFKVSRKRVGDILHWCNRQIALGRAPSTLTTSQDSSTETTLRGEA